MSTKTFKVGEYGMHPKYKLVAGKGEVSVVSTSWKGNVADMGHVEYDCLEVLSNFLSNEITSYYADKMLEWVKSTKEYQGSIAVASFHTQMDNILGGGY